MPKNSWAVWLVGPPGAGKSTLSRSLRDLKAHVVDPDRDLIARLRKAGIDADMRRLSAAETARFLELRQSVSDAQWRRVSPALARRRNLVLETTGNQPELLEDYSAQLKAAGYRQYTLLLHSKLGTVLERNAARRRVVDPATVRRIWRECRRLRSDRAYERLIRGPVIAVDTDRTGATDEALAALRAWTAAPSRTKTAAGSLSSSPHGRRATRRRAARRRAAIRPPGSP
jgi:predicted kinase